MVAKNQGQLLGALFIVLGLFFLLGRYLNLGALSWPLFVIIPGLLLFAGMVMGGKSAAGLALPGSIVTTVGLILFFQNATNTFESWSYVWALIIVAVGVGRIIQGIRTNERSPQREGSRLIALGLALFAAFGLFFELFIFHTWADTLLGRYLFPLLLIGGGGYLLTRRSNTPAPSVTLEPVTPVPTGPSSTVAVTPSTSTSSIPVAQQSESNVTPSETRVTPATAEEVDQNEADKTEVSRTEPEPS
jgi:hypothetical protein